VFGSVSKTNLPEPRAMPYAYALKQPGASNTIGTLGETELGSAGTQPDKG